MRPIPLQCQPNACDLHKRVWPSPEWVAGTALRFRYYRDQCRADLRATPCLRQLVRLRLEGLPAQTRRALLPVSALTRSTLAILEQATGTPALVRSGLEKAAEALDSDRTPGSVKTVVAVS